MNTREYRYRKRLEDERHKLVEKAMKTIPNYHPPSDYRRPTKTQEKVYVPVNDYPEINFSMITNPLTPNHSFIVSVMSPCSTRVDESYLLGCPQLVSCQTLVLNAAHTLKKIWITNT